MADSHLGDEKRGLPWYGWLGAGMLSAGEVGLFLDLLPVRILFYGIAWWSYIFLIDAVVWRRRGYSLVRNRPKEFWFLAFWSVPLWNLFELFNFRLQNWFYINVPVEGFFALLFNLTSYATVLPGLFETYELLNAYQVANEVRIRRWRITPLLLAGFGAVGLGMLAVPLLWPRLGFPLIWGFAVFFGDPFCYWVGPTRANSLLGQLERGDPRVFLRLLLAGLICGGLWEFWNFWAYTKWLYTVPYFEHLKWFEMPPLGFVGFAPFALECYVLVNLLNVARRGRSWEAWDRTGPGTPRWLAIPAIAVALIFNGFVYAGLEAFTVKSVAPTLAEMDNVDEKVLEGLGRSGVTTPPRLLRRTATGEDLATLARQSGIPPDDLLALREAARLVDLAGLGATNSNALRRVGITTIEELAQQDPVVLLPRWQAAVTERPPTLPQVRLWVRAARRSASGNSPALPGS